MSGVRGALARVSWLYPQSRVFLLPGKNVEVIYTPDNYYEALKVMFSKPFCLFEAVWAQLVTHFIDIFQHGVQKARKRVIWSSLYLGTGSREAELVCTT